MRKYITPNYNGSSGSSGTRPLIPRPHFSDSLHSNINCHQNSYTNESNSMTINNRSLHKPNDTTALNGISSASTKADHLCTTLTSERMLYLESILMYLNKSISMIRIYPPRS
uniref:SJCHGC07178 protein n=1 Tax=Schistosoma japonicum TaxID=6182 RepID=Q5DGY7_SCHJA|nr:SJCHGC07178 protein [Schistosoma japonicum]